MLGILQQTGELSKHTLHQSLMPTLILSSEIEKVLKRSESGTFSQILMHNSFWKTNGIRLKFFTQTILYTGNNAAK